MSERSYLTQLSPGKEARRIVCPSPLLVAAFIFEKGPGKRELLRVRQKGNCDDLGSRQGGEN